MSRQGKAMLAVAISSMIFGFSFLFSGVALSVTSVFVLLSSRFTLAFIAMNLLWLCKPSRLQLRGKPWKKLVGMGIFQPILYFIGENYGIQLTNTSFAGVMIALIPIVATLMAAVFLKERPSGGQLAFIGCSLAGVAFCSLVEGGAGQVSAKGVLLLCLAVFAGAGFTLVSRESSREFTAFERTYVMFGIGCVFFILMGIVENKAAFPMRLAAAWREPHFLAAVCYLGLASSVAAFFLQHYAITYLTVARTLIFANVTTVVAILAGVLILHEPFSAMQGFSIFLILFGVYGVNKTNKTTQKY